MVNHAERTPQSVVSPGAPVSTYRVQLHAGFTFADLAAQVPYLAQLGVTHVYLSPILQAAPGSMHGYDVTDHAQLNVELGGEAGFAELTRALEAACLRAVTDIVPNHMTLPTPASLNAPWYDVLLHGPLSAYAKWFDIDWTRGTVVVPVLGAPLAECLERGEISLDRSGPAPVLRYFDHVFPVREGTEELRLPQLLDVQHYELAFWRSGTEELNYRRFFDVTTLAGIRVEDHDVFQQSHARILELVASGGLTGLRVDHPDGLADPGGYVRTLREATGGAWIVIEKILEGDERLPTEWPCDGTTGYDALARLAGVFTDPAGIPALTELYVELTGEPEDFHSVVEEGKRDAVTRLLTAEVRRLADIVERILAGGPLPNSSSRDQLVRALTELLVAFPVYRAYVRPGEEAPAESVRLVADAVAATQSRVPAADALVVALLGDLALGRRGRGPHHDDFVVRFQQTCGPAMAKGVEDTAFYRWFRLTSANEVGGDPAQPTLTPADYLAWCATQQQREPAGMTTLTTHDTKRSEDVRARLAVLSEVPAAWAETVRRLQQLTGGYRPALLDANTEYLLWQTLVGAWPLSEERLLSYLEKATREAKRHTTWTEPDPAYDDAVATFARGVLADGAARDVLSDFVDRLAPAWRANVLGQKLLQLMQPGVPDVYQGTEVVTDSLVDPDNRRAVDFASRATALADLDAGKAPSNLDAEKQHVVSTALRLRRGAPQAFLGADATFEPVTTSTPHALAFCRSGHVIPVVTRLSTGLVSAGGWGDATITLPDGEWRDTLIDGSPLWSRTIPLRDLLAERPVALLVRSDSSPV